MILKEKYRVSNLLALKQYRAEISEGQYNNGLLFETQILLFW